MTVAPVTVSSILLTASQPLRCHLWWHHILTPTPSGHQVSQGSCLHSSLPSPPRPTAWGQAFTNCQTPAVQLSPCLKRHLPYDWVSSLSINIHGFPLVSSSHATGIGQTQTFKIGFTLPSNVSKTKIISSQHLSVMRAHIKKCDFRLLLENWGSAIQGSYTRKTTIRKNGISAAFLRRSLTAWLTRVTIWSVSLIYITFLTSVDN